MISLSSSIMDFLKSLLEVVDFGPLPEVIDILSLEFTFGLARLNSFFMTLVVFMRFWLNESCHLGVKGFLFDVIDFSLIIELLFLFTLKRFLFIGLLFPPL